jgi:hypothetical protein
MKKIKKEDAQTLNGENFSSAFSKTLKEFQLSELFVKLLTNAATKIESLIKLLEKKDLPIQRELETLVNTLKPLGEERSKQWEKQNAVAIKKLENKFGKAHFHKFYWQNFLSADKTQIDELKKRFDDALRLDDNFNGILGQGKGRRFRQRYRGVVKPSRNLIEACVKYYALEESAFFLWIREYAKLGCNTEIHDGSMNPVVMYSKENFSKITTNQPIPFIRIVNTKHLSNRNCSIKKLKEGQLERKSQAFSSGPTDNQKCMDGTKEALRTRRCDVPVNISMPNGFFSPAFSTSSDAEKTFLGMSHFFSTMASSLQQSQPHCPRYSSQRSRDEIDILGREVHLRKDHSNKEGEIHCSVEMDKKNPYWRLVEVLITDLEELTIDDIPSDKPIQRNQERKNNVVYCWFRVGGKSEIERKKSWDELRGKILKELKQVVAEELQSYSPTRSEKSNSI